MNHITVIVKPTLACNANCKYCYFKDIRTLEKMDITIFKIILNKLKNYEYVKFIFHGGEPLLMGIDWYKEVIKLQKETTLKIKNDIQTNLILLNDEWIKFFKENDFHISTSLDGIKEVHDVNRGNFDIIIKNIKKLNEHNIRIGAVAVVDEKTIPYLYENFQLYEDLNVCVRINPQTYSNTNKNSISTQQKVYEFIVKFYNDMWMNSNDNNFRIDPCCEILNFLISGKDPGCAHGKKSCVGRFPAILWNGDVIHCGRFVGTNHGYLGNVNDSNFSFGLDNPLILKYYNMDLDRIKKCESCEYYNICHGGCFHHAIILGNGKDIYCEAYKGIIKHILIRRQQLGD